MKTMEDAWAFKYGYCPPECPTHNEAMRNNWKTDETFKMTLHYDNSILLTGLQFYVKLFFGILSFSLILTTVLTAIGKILVQSQLRLLSLTSECQLQAKVKISTRCCKYSYEKFWQTSLY